MLPLLLLLLLSLLLPLLLLLLLLPTSSATSSAKVVQQTEAWTFLKRSENLSFLSSKKQFKWSGHVDSLKVFWIDALEQGDPSLQTINFNGTCDVLKFESVTVNFYHRTKTVQVQGISKEEYIKKLTEIVSKNQGNQVINEDEEGQRESVTSTKGEDVAAILNPSPSADEPMATVEDDGICSCTCKACSKIQSLDHRMFKLDEKISNIESIIL